MPLDGITALLRMNTGFKKAPEACRAVCEGKHHGRVVVLVELEGEAAESLPT